MNYRVAIIDDDGGVRHHIADLLAETAHEGLASRRGKSGR